MKHTDIPRIREITPMLGAHEFKKDHIYETVIRQIKQTAFDDACSSYPPFDPDSGCYGYSKEIKERKEKYLIYGSDKHNINTIEDIRWELLKPDEVKRIQDSIDYHTKVFNKQIETWNKYIDQDDVVFVRARIGAGNWKAYGGDEIEKEDWFLEKVDDYFDETYCDIFCRIKK